MKKIKLLIMVFAVILLTGCVSTKKESLSASEFVDKVSNTDYTLVDVSDNYGYADNAYLISTEDVHIEYLVMDTISDASGNYIDEVENVIKTLDSVNYTKDNGENWNSFEVTTDSKYYYIEYVGRTYLYIESTLDSKENVQKFIKELNY